VKLVTSWKRRHLNSARPASINWIMLSPFMVCAAYQFRAGPFDFNNMKKTQVRKFWLLIRILY
jgi:hypothetical protein